MRLLGYLPPGVCMGIFSLAILEVRNTTTLDTYYTDKYHNSYAEDGKWYAFKVEEP